MVSEIALEGNESLSNDAVLREFATVSLHLTCSEQIEDQFKSMLKLNSEITLQIGLSRNLLESLIEKELWGMVVVGKEFPLWFHADSSSNELIDCSLQAGEHGDGKDVIKAKCEIKSVVQSMDIVSTIIHEKFDRAVKLKELGTELFRAGNSELAFTKYRRALQYLILIRNSVKSEIPEKYEDYSTLKLQCHLNIAACQSSKQSWDFVIENCTSALSLDGCCTKALYRRAKAYEAIGQWEEAVLDWQRSVDCDPENMTFRKHLANARTRTRQKDATLAQGLSKMFQSK